MIPSPMRPVKGGYRRVGSDYRRRRRLGRPAGVCLTASSPRLVGRCVAEEEAARCAVLQAQNPPTTRTLHRPVERNLLIGGVRPRGIWSDGDVMYVADASDGRVYTYNMPDAIDARPSSLTLSGVDVGDFDPGQTDYAGVIAEGVTETTVVAEAMQHRTDIAIHPPDADQGAGGHQVSVKGGGNINVTVTSADGLRTRSYRVSIERTPLELTLEPDSTSLSGQASMAPPSANALGRIAKAVAVVLRLGGGHRGVACVSSLGSTYPGLNTMDHV